MADAEPTYAALRAQVHQRLAAGEADVSEEDVTDTCLAIGAFAHEQEAMIEILFPDVGERHLAMRPWQEEIAALRQLSERAYQDARAAGAPVPLAEQAVNMALWAEFFRLPYGRGRLGG